jgi:hypothetical protein
MPSMEYGTWANVTGDISVEATIANYVGDYADDYDLPEIAREYRAAINRALPKDFTLCGDNFIGPYPGYDFDFSEYIDSADLEGIAEAYDSSE